MEILIYLKTLTLFVALSICGFIIVRRICEDARIQIALPSAIIVGISLYIFLLNLTAYLIKGYPGFLFALLIEILVAIFIKKRAKASPILIPKGIEKRVWVITSFFWFILVYIISATGNASSGDWQNHSTLAALFLRGDFPIHSPFQPDKLSSYHIGVAEFLGALRFFTQGPYTFLGSVLSVVALFVLLQIFQWLIKIKPSLFNLLLCILLPIITFISFGSFMITWPIHFSFPYLDLFQWFSKFPGLYSTYDTFGSPSNLSALNLFLHRMLSMAILVSLLPLILFPNLKRKLLLCVVLIILLATIALTDETIFIISVPVLTFISFFTVFEKNIKQLIIFCFILLIVAIFQGGLINEVIFKSENTIANVLLFPKDQQGPTARFERYRSFRLEQESSKLLADKKEHYPLRWFHPSASIQIIVLFILSTLLTLSIRNKLENKSHIYLLWLFILVSVTSLVAFFVIVPKGIYHTNGNRFLSLSYQFSGSGIALLIILWWIYFRGQNALVKFLINSLKLIIIWIILTSTIGPFTSLFPRNKDNWFDVSSPPKRAELVWIEDNLGVHTKILPFIQNGFPSAGPVLELAREVGIYTPVWYEKPQSQGFEVSPPYLDLFFTLNPEILEILKVEYIMTNKLYRTTLSKERLADLSNKEYFQTMYSDRDQDTIISKILPAYFLKAENYKGTFYELSQILPSKGAFFIEAPPGIDQTVWRVVFLTLQMHDYEMYYSTEFIPTYNFIINVDLKFNGEANDKYDYLALGANTNPVTICNCQTSLFWNDVGNNVKIWKVN